MGIPVGREEDIVDGDASKPAHQPPTAPTTSTRPAASVQSPAPCPTTPPINPAPSSAMDNPRPPTSSRQQLTHLPDPKPVQQTARSTVPKPSVSVKPPANSAPTATAVKPEPQTHPIPKQSTAPLSAPIAKPALPAQSKGDPSLSVTTLRNASPPHVKREPVSSVKKNPVMVKKEPVPTNAKSPVAGPSAVRPVVKSGTLATIVKQRQDVSVAKPSLPVNRQSATVKPVTMPTRPNKPVVLPNKASAGAPVETKRPLVSQKTARPSTQFLHTPTAVARSPAPVGKAVQLVKKTSAPPVKQVPQNASSATTPVKRYPAVTSASTTSPAVMKPRVVPQAATPVKQVRPPVPGQRPTSTPVQVKRQTVQASTNAAVQVHRASVRPNTTPVARPVGSATQVARPVGSTTQVARPIGSATQGTRPVGSATQGARPVGSTAQVVRPVGGTTPVARPVASTAQVVRPVGSTTPVVRPVGSTTQVARPVGSTPGVVRRPIVKSVGGAPRTVVAPGRTMVSGSGPGGQKMVTPTKPMVGSRPAYVNKTPVSGRPVATAAPVQRASTNPAISRAIARPSTVPARANVAPTKPVSATPIRTTTPKPVYRAPVAQITPTNLTPSKRHPVIPPEALAAAAAAAAAVEPTPPLQPRSTLCAASVAASRALAAQSLAHSRSVAAAAAALHPKHTPKAVAAAVAPTPTVKSEPVKPKPAPARIPAGMTFADGEHVTIWNKLEKRKIAGNAAPLGKNLEKYLRMHTDCEVYEMQDHNLPGNRNGRKRPKVSVGEAAAGDHIAIWNRVEKRKIAGNAAPLAKNLKSYLAKRPDCEVYEFQDIDLKNKQQLARLEKSRKQSQQAAEVRAQASMAAAAAAANEPLDAWRHFDAESENINALYKTEYEQTAEFLLTLGNEEEDVSPVVMTGPIGVEEPHISIDVDGFISLDQDDSDSACDFFERPLPPLNGNFEIPGSI